MSVPRRLAVGSGRLVGRSAESAVLARQIAAVSAGAGGFTFVVGEPGIGKTRLVEEAADAARGARLRVLRGRASRAGTSRMRPLAEALLGLAREGWSPPDDLGPYRAVLGQLVPDWRPKHHTPAPAPPFIHGEAILRMAGLPDAPGTLLVLEDLHDADQDTIAVLEYLLDNAAGLPLAVFCTAREIPGPAHELAEYARLRGPEAVHLPLARLDESATGELAATLLGTDQRLLGDTVRESLFRDSVGNPLALIEILRELVASRALARRNGAWTIPAEMRAPAPRSLARSVADQLRREEPGTLALLRAAAVLGEDFPADLVGTIAAVDGDGLWRALDSAVCGQLLVPTDRDGWFAFRHPLLERAVRDQLTSAERERLVLLAAAAIETCESMGDERWARAAVLRESAGDKPGASVLFRTAGRRAAAGGSPALAVDLLRRAIGCLPAERRDGTWAETIGLLVDALGMSGRYQEALSCAEEIGAAASGLPPETVAGLHLRLARVALRAGRRGQVAPYIEVAMHALADLPAIGLRAESDAIEAYLRSEEREPGREAEVESLARRAIDRARAAGLPSVECDALLTLGYHYGNRRPESALESYRRAYRVACANNLAVLRSESLLLLGGHQWAWHVDASGLLAAEAEAIVDGAVIEARTAQSSLAVDALMRARFSEFEARLGPAWEDISRLGLPRLGSYALALKAVAYAHQGREDEMLAAISEFDRWRGEADDEVPLVRGLALGFSALLHGDLARARSLIDSLRAPDGTFTEAKYNLCGEFGLGALLDAVSGPADWSRHREIAAQTAAGLPWNRQFVEFARAVLTGREGRRAEAETALAEAVATAEPFPLARHLSLSLIAPCAARDGWGGPIRWLQEAEAFFRQVGVPIAARTCRERLREVGGPARQWRDGSELVPRELWAVGVTVREYEVLQLVAADLSNRQIAAELHLSYRTVERHVTSLFAKTGAADRRGLAARLE